MSVNIGEKNLTQELYVKAKKIIPGGTQLLSKRPEMSAPDQWPAYFTKASGCEVWDLDGKHYYDMATNLSVNLGENDGLRGHLLPGLEPVGVPTELRNTAYAFKFNDREGFQAIIDKVGNKLAAVIMEPCKYHDPEPGFLEFVKEKTHQVGALLIFDEITIGWRLTYGGSHLKLGVNPDLAFYAKALGNGYPIGAVIGTREAMEGAHKSFISSTYWTESIGPVAALATVKKMREVKVHEHASRIGSMVMASWKTHAKAHGIEIAMDDGYPCLAHFSFKHEKSEVLQTLYTQMMLERGFLGTVAIYPTAAHTEEIVQKYDRAIDEVFGQISLAIKQDKLSGLLKGPIAHAGFRRLN